jgi:hypothetical protein
VLWITRPLVADDDFLQLFSGRSLPINTLGSPKATLVIKLLAACSSSSVMDHGTQPETSWNQLMALASTIASLKLREGGRKWSRCCAMFTDIKAPPCLRRKETPEHSTSLYLCTCGRTARKQEQNSSLFAESVSLQANPCFSVNTLFLFRAKAASIAYQPQNRSRKANSGMLGCYPVSFSSRADY